MYLELYNTLRVLDRNARNIREKPKPKFRKILVKTLVQFMYPFFLIFFVIQN